MSPTSDRIGEYLRAEEPLRGVYAATLSDDSAPKEVSVGVTDRRLLCLSSDGTFLNIGYDSICAVRSHPRSTLTYRGNDARLVLGGGALLAVLGFVALVALTSNPAVPVLGFATVVGLVATVGLYRTEVGSDLAPLDEVERRAPPDFDGMDALRRAADGLPVDGEGIPVLAGALATVALLAGTVALAANPLAVLLLVPVVAGVALVDYARSHGSEFDGIEVSREHALNVRISTDDGRTVRLKIDPSADIDRELSKLAFVGEDEPVQRISART